MEDLIKRLEMPKRFDLSQILLDDLRARIRHALLSDSIDGMAAPRMTATEVLHRAETISRQFGNAGVLGLYLGGLGGAACVIASLIIW